jgi:hypothetical protein
MRNLVFLFLVVCLSTNAQFIVRPIISQNAFQIQFYGNGTYNYGGKFGSTAFVPGLDLEYRFTKELDSLSSPMKLSTNSSFALLFSASYWKYTNVETGFNKDGDALSSSYRSQFVAMPLLAKYYVQLGILNENMRIGWGLGVMGLYRLSTELGEEAIMYTRDPVTNGVISQQTVETTADIAKQSPLLTIGFCLELSIEYSHFYFAFRAYQSGQDQYAKGFEANYGLPEDQSIYRLAYKEYPKIIYTGGGILLGWRINRLKHY